MTERPRASRGLAASIAKVAASRGEGFFTLRTFPSAGPAAPWETYGGVLVGERFRPLFFVDDHGVMRTASALVLGDGEARFETPKGPILAEKMGALVAASARALDERPTVLDLALALREALTQHGLRVEFLGRWEGTLGAKAMHPASGAIALGFLRASGLELAIARRSSSGRLVAPVEAAPIESLPAIDARVRALAAEVPALLG